MYPFVVFTPPRLRHLLRTLDCPKLTHPVEAPDPDILFPFEKEALSDGRLAR